MNSPLDPSQAPVGDVATALMQVDALLVRAKEFGSPESDTGIERMVASVTSLDELIAGLCTVIYLYMTYLRRAHEAAGRDVIADVVPSVVRNLRRMSARVAPEAVPTMTGLVTAAAMQLSPTLWRAQFGPWAKEDVQALKATALVLAEHINQRAHDDSAAIRLVADVLAQAEET